MATITITIPDAAVSLLQDTYGDLSVWLTAMVKAEAIQQRDTLTRKDLVEVMKDEAFLNELAPLVRRHRRA